jgi:protein-histidine pros-kinase
LEELLLHESPDAVVVTTPDGKVLFWNNEAENVFGYTSDEAVGQPLESLIIPEARREQDNQLRNEAIANGLSTFEATRKRKDGSLVFAIVSNKAVYDDKGRIELIVSSKKDVTHLKVLRDAKLAEAKFRDVLESTPDAIIMANETGRIVLANSQAERLFGYDHGELLAKLVELLLPGGYRTSHLTHGSGYFAQLRTRSMGAGLELYGLRKDGSEFPVEISLSPLRTEEGTLVTTSIRDISDRKRIERELQEKNAELERANQAKDRFLASKRIESALQEKNAELERANQAKDRFLASMSHELRTPLNGIIGFSEFLSDGRPGPINDKQKEYLGDILNSGRHLLHLINDMLDLVKVQAGKVELMVERFRLGDAINEVCAGVRPIAETKRIKMKVEIAPGLDFVTLDEQRFKQILYNLVSNALKFTDDGGHVGIAAAFLGQDRFQLTVCDDGIGIRKEDIGRLFTEFEQLETGTARRFGGTGLGLALTRSLVALHGGVIDVKSEIGKGSTFRVIVPLVARESA